MLYCGLKNHFEKESTFLNYSKGLQEGFVEEETYTDWS